MIATTNRKDLRALRPSAGRYGIRLRISPAAREDAWELCRAAVVYGGVEVRDCYFVFSSEQRRRSAQEALQLQFGPEYFEVLDLPRMVVTK
jgi:hypothetical protein